MIKIAKKDLNPFKRIQATTKQLHPTTREGKTTIKAIVVNLGFFLAEFR